MTPTQRWIPLAAISVVLAAVAVTLPSCGQADSHEQQVIVLGFDGMDPKLVTEMMDAGQLPALAKLRDAGGFRPLGTSTPPQSPVAWSSLITGTNPGQHGIFDFIHRDPKNYMPYESTARTEEGGWPIHLGKYLFQLKSPEVVNLRHGEPFWKNLTEAGVPAQVYRMPAIYPPEESDGAHFCCLADMGTPDIRGSNGEFSYYTDGPFNFRKSMGGGKAYRVRFRKHAAKTAFYGPPDGLLAPEMKNGKPVSPPPVETLLMIYRDPTEPTVRLVWGDQDVLLAEGEWSDWHPVEFKMGPQVGDLTELIPGSTAKAICRIYVKQVRPVFQLYVTPLNIDPLAPVLPISVPDDFVVDVAKKIGRHYTQGLAEDTKALSHKILSRDEFLAQAAIVLDERLKMFDYALDNYTGGLLFFYFGSTDQVAHMFWGARNPDHPALTAEEHEKYKHVVEDIYVKADAVVAKAIDRFPKATLMVMSDHGFETFTRQFNLNNWLVDNGYARPLMPEAYDLPINFKWSRTKAYAMGINGLYINLYGRERDGIVPASQKQALMDEIMAKLLEYRDPESGLQVIRAVYQSDKIYSGPHLSLAPDLQIGYDRTFRASWATALGQISRNLMSDNTDAWCADHCIATDLVPGVLFSNRPIALQDPTLEDIAPTVLEEFGVAVPERMHGRNVFQKAAAVAWSGKE
ncbi:MAG: alkaline phosphatase family protein [Planctomycetes bacterium]|nr:alkaline phosphatase family protein [Planctomycetota bacterium]